MLYHSRYSLSGEENEVEDIPADVEPLMLPTRLKGCYWNGERWCGTPFLPRLASARNGYELLHEKIMKSHKTLISCRMGRYFLKSSNQIELKGTSKKGQHAKSRSMHPTVPKLNLKAVNQDFEYSKQLANNAALIFAYRVEAKRIASTRSSSISNRPTEGERGSFTSRKGMLTERSICGTVPPKAVADSSLRQLSNILDKETRFIAVQESLNKQLRQVTRAIETTRPFSYTRQFTALNHLSPAQKSWKNRPTDSPRLAETFRRNLECHRWYEDLINMMFLGNRRPTKPEYDILDYVAHALERGSQFNGDEYVKLLKSLEKKGADLNESATSQALSYIRYVLRIPDEVILEGYLRKCTVIPAFLSSIDVPKNYSRLTSRLTNSSRGPATAV
ncbi:hypothetical protein KP509_05G095100 [Ceratopteris richardii]|nr:hypothetical protein KP509_05G095100 [Ceratopteris richardii]